METLDSITTVYSVVLPSPYLHCIIPLLAAPGLSRHAYTETHTVCSVEGFCECVEGFKEDGDRCVRCKSIPQQVAVLLS